MTSSIGTRYVPDLAKTEPLVMWVVPRDFPQLRSDDIQDTSHVALHLVRR